MNVLLLQLLKLERRNAEDRRDTARAAQHGDGRVRWRHRYGQRIELGVIGLAERCDRRHLQYRGLYRHLDRGNRDAVALAKILDRLDVGIGGVEQERLRAERADTLDLERAALRLVPQRDQAGHAAGHDVGGIRQQRVVHRRRAIEALPGYLEILQAALRGIFLDQF